MNLPLLALVATCLFLAAWLYVAVERSRRAKRRRRAQLLDAAVRARQLVELIPERGVTVRGASRDRSRPGKARRRERRA